MKILLIYIWCSLLGLQSAWAYRPPSDAVQSLSDASIYNECLWNREIIANPRVDVDCNDLFHHYKAKEQSYKPKKDVRIGSYNIFRGYEQQQKRWDLTAEMINSEWDIVALSELQPNKSSFLQANINAIIAHRQDKINDEQLQKAYHRPSYLKLLQELQKRDPSWSLIIAPYSQSDYDTELFGFVYRSRQVKILESRYCRNEYLGANQIKPPFIYQEIRADDYLSGIANSAGFVKSMDGKPINDREFVAPKEALGCVLKLSEFSQANIPKVPFVARFKSGRFDFSYMSLHLGFRGPKEERIPDQAGSQCGDDCQAHTQTVLDLMLSTFKDGKSKNEILDIFKAIPRFGLTTSRKIVRFFQLHEAIEESRRIRAIEGDRDLIIGGDFNLEPNQWMWQGYLWSHMVDRFGNGKVLVNEPTTLSRTNGFASRYDHFIVASGLGDTDECADGAAKAQRFDFVDKKATLSNGFNLGEELRQYSYKKYFKDIVESTVEKLMQKFWVSTQGDILSTPQLRKAIEVTKGYELRPLTMSASQWCDEDGSESGRFHLALPDAIASETFCKLRSEKPYEKYLAALSDHVPISMTCSAQAGDQP